MSVLKSENWIRDIKFNLKEYLKVEDLFEFQDYQDISWDDVDLLLDEARKISQEVLYSINVEGDRVGATLVDGKVVMPDSFKAVWQTFCENGWGSLPMNPEYGGSGLPQLVAGACSEMIQASNPAFMLFPGLSIGSGRLIESFGTEELKETYIEKMYTGEWTGTMCLTEPQAGSDLGLVRTKAVREGNAYKITGSKIFITCGDHDLAENIIHLVLARVEGAPEGTKGISLFVVPKYLVDENGSIGERNDVEVIAIEEKMGFHASPTCALEFGSKDHCIGYLVGEENKGMKQMFQMMNEARLLVGTVSLAIASQAYDHALSYAKERVQGSKLSDMKGPAARIIEHEDVRRMLMHMKASTEGIRGMLYKAFYLSDVELHGGSDEQREEAADMLAFLVPLCKSYASDRVWDLTRDAIQVHGGYGFVKEYPVEQLARESKIQSIWEGTNYIQSMDLIGRKLPMKMGAVTKRFIEEHLLFCKENETKAGYENAIGLLNKASGLLGQTVMTFSEWLPSSEARRLGWGATRFLDSVAEITISKVLLEQAFVADEALKGNVSADDRLFYEGKKVTANYFVTNILPNAISRLQTVLKSDASTMDLNEKAF